MLVDTSDTEGGLESHARPKLDLPLTIKFRGIDVERPAKFRLSALQSGQVVKSRKAPVYASGLNRIAHVLQLCHVLVIEEVEGFGQQLKLALPAQVESLADTHVGLPHARVTVGVAAHAIDTVVTAISIHSS